MKKVKMILLMSAIATLGLAAVTFSACGEHEHVWENEYRTVKRPTCSEYGEKVRKCTVKGCTAEDKQQIEKLAHTWDSQQINTATCTEGGHMAWVCTVCGEMELGKETEALGHDMIDDQIYTYPTCYREGVGDKKCTRCDYVEKNVTLPKLDHIFELSEEDSTPATCQAEGKEVYYCKNEGCNEKKTVTLEKTDHNMVYDSNTSATFDSDGFIQGHCTNCDKTVSEPVPKLVEGQEMEFQFKLLRRNEPFQYTLPSMSFTVVNEKGEEVKKDLPNVMIKGVYRVKLPIYRTTEYTLKVSGLQGMHTDDSMKVTPTSPVCEINFYPKLLAMDAPETDLPRGYFAAGNVAQDFELTDLNGRTIRLSEILKTKKVVMLNFFFSTCTACNFEAEGMQAAYEMYKDKGLEIIGISDEVNEATGITGVKAYKDLYKLTYPIAMQSGTTARNYLSSRYVSSGFPTLVFIDHEGLIVEMPQAAGYSQPYFEDWFERYTSVHWDDLDAPANTVVGEPKDETNGLLISMLRGDYLPSSEEN